MLFPAAAALTRVRNEINALDLQKQGNVVRLEKLSAEKIQLEEERVRVGNTACRNSRPMSKPQKLNVQTQRGTVEERQSAPRRDPGLELNQAGQELDKVLAATGGKTFAA